MRRWLILLLLLVPSATMQAQSYWEFSAAGSYMMANNFNMPEVNRPACGVEVAYMHRTDGSQEWHLLRRQPSFGLKGSFTYIVDGAAGHRFGLVGVIKAPLGHTLDYHLALGLAYFTKPYCLTHDTNNIFISSIVSCLIDIGLDWNMSDNLFLTASFLHSSNGMLYRPNKGFNFLQMGIGYRVLPSKLPARYEGAVQPLQWHRHKVGFTLSNGLAMSRHLMQDGHAPCYDLSLNYQYYLSPIVAVGATADFWYNHNHTWQLPRYHDRYPLPVYFNLQANCEGFWGPVSLKVGVGGVLLTSSLVGKRIYERVGVYYNWADRYAGIGLNARAGFAEFIELSYGRRIAVSAPLVHASTASSYQKSDLLVY